MTREAIGRREFLKWCGLAAATGALGDWASTPVWAGPVAPTPATAKPAQLVMVWQIIGNQDKLFKPVLDRWRADYGVAVRWIQTPNIEEQETKALSLFVSRSVMDVFAVTITSFARFAEQNMIRPLDGLPGLEGYFRETAPAVRSLTRYKGKTLGLMQWVASHCGAYNKRLLAAGGWRAPARTWDEWEDHCLKAKRDGISPFPALWMAGPGIDHINSVFYSLVASAGGKVTEADGTPILGPGSKARETLKWWAKSFLETRISDPRSLELRYYPAARAYALGRHLYHLGTRQTFFTAINGGDSPTVGQHDIFKQPGGPAIITGDLACIGSSSRSPEWAWRLMQYLVGRTKDNEWLGPTKLATEVLTPYPGKALEDPATSKLWGSYFTLDTALQTFADTVAITEVAPAILAPWWSKWQDTVNVKLQESLKGLITPDAACDAMATEAMKLKG